MIDWDSLRFFSAFARVGSLAAAARLLGVEHATVARRIAALETSLNMKLVDRRGHAYQLTEDGVRVSKYAAQGLHDRRFLASSGSSWLSDYFYSGFQENMGTGGSVAKTEFPWLSITPRHGAEIPSKLKKDGGSMPGRHGLA